MDIKLNKKKAIGLYENEKKEGFIKTCQLTSYKLCLKVGFKYDIHIYYGYNLFEQVKVKKIWRN